jgi:hypothetical protein
LLALEVFLFVSSVATGKSYDLTKRPLMYLPLTFLCHMDDPTVPLLSIK